MRSERRILAEERGIRGRESGDIPAREMQPEGWEGRKTSLEWGEGQVSGGVRRWERDRA